MSGEISNTGHIAMEHGTKLFRGSGAEIICLIELVPIKVTLISTNIWLHMELEPNKEKSGARAEIK